MFSWLLFLKKTVSKAQKPSKILTKSHFARSFHCSAACIFDVLSPVTVVYPCFVLFLCEPGCGCPVQRWYPLLTTHCVHQLAVLPVTSTNLFRLSLTKWHIIYELCVSVWRLSDKMEGNVNLHRNTGSETSFLWFLLFVLFFPPLLWANAIVHILL